MTVMNAPLRSGLRSRPLIRGAAALTALGLGTLAVTGCGTGPGGGDNGKVKVAASFYPLEFLTTTIGGEHVDVQSLTKPGVEPHDLELSPQQTGELGEADLAVYLKGLQPGVDQAIEQSEVKNVAEATSFTTLEKHGSSVKGESHEGAHAEEEKGHEGHDEGAHAEEEKGHEGHNHDATGGDPHLWLDPLRYAEVAEGIGKKLAKADPKHKATYEKNTADLVDRLKALDKEFEEGLKDRKTDTFVTTHSAFGYLAERYGLHEEAVNGIDPEAGPSAARLKELHKITEEDEVGTVFFENNASDRTARTLADDLKLKTGVLSPLESVKDPEKQDYFSVMRENLTALQGALGSR